MPSFGDYKLGDIIIEGKTKKVYHVANDSQLCMLIGKDRITAGDGVKAHDMTGKAEISNKTNERVFTILNNAGIKTAFVKSLSSNAFLAKKCEMVPIEWVARRYATGSFLKRNPGVTEGYRFSPPKIETFFKDDANHDPQWSDEQIISAKFDRGCIVVGPSHVDLMKRTTVLVFEILEKAWATRNCSLIDMKVEYGVDLQGNVLLADIIDSDSWRLWPSGDKRLMVDKQVYRNLATVTEKDLDQVKRNFIWVGEQLKDIIPNDDHLVVILMGSVSDMDHCKKIAKKCSALGVKSTLRITSAHKGTENTLQIMREYEGMQKNLIFIAVAGRSNGLGPVLSANTSYPVINCPPLNTDNMHIDVWSSLNVPSGLGCVTALYPETAALHAAQILGCHNYMIWSKVRTQQLETLFNLRNADENICVDCDRNNDDELV